MNRFTIKRLFTTLLLAFAESLPTLAENAAPALQNPNTRPYLFNDAQRARIRRLVESENWAQREYQRIERLAHEGDGYWSAFPKYRILPI